jgi:hypothetical protein
MLPPRRALLAAAVSLYFYLRVKGTTTPLYLNKVSARRCARVRQA